ncbi:MAG: tRNA uridine-5-carboxymethylaminomethyl(34) synthesis GTPase MnmE [Flavobacteriales bacterium]|nr:tRNA uridine-5-carboxymethylaminomethyl(34) synthesis GTPase MnmE [Flavobacteriales bacterium]MBK7941705.1 tRNA uridine-5-carboxymethylaminomethyl(34) synthesis GTPase MnmE [Flavobacteriales bacterium]MBK8949269.1 tRNA uridine-5-carboxymethylaminomethyl(34) synthesis GTPase MnmE [Flavobacteriales bacterium]MBK9700247.1 tRNA uridine-5-carboxymethylaminomethyl(34) synthesis GTPase MnmE [Flavobacteriales bacterium]
MTDQDTICAPATAGGAAAVAVVRLSGPRAVAILDRLTAGAARTWPERRAVLAPLADAEGPIDEALVTVFRAPASYTGEEVVELGLHGSPYIVQRVLEAAVQAGARLARPGEFTLRAFLNRKLDLSQAEAVADLIAGQGAAAHRLALQQLRGGYSAHIDALRQQLIDFCALIELELDFGEEDVTFARRDELDALLVDLTGLCTRLIDSFRYGNAVKEGVPVAIVGAPNSGKSTLLNALLQEDRAIVSDIPGTTRDTVEETITLNGILFRFIDTAGLRETGDTVERMGIERSYRKAREAGIVVLLGDAAAMNEDAFLTQAALLRERIGEGPHLLPVLNKCDLTDQDADLGGRVMRISARTGRGLDGLREAFHRHVRSLHEGDGGVVVTNARHVEALSHARQALEDARAGLHQGVSGDLLAIDLRRAQHHLGEITGRITPDDVLGSIFGRFCIGK